MKTSYRAMQVSRPGVLELVEREAPQPGPGEVLIQVEACGICGADAGAIEGLEAGIEYPRVPGHEVVGRIVAAGPGAVRTSTSTVARTTRPHACARWAARRSS